MLAKSHHPVEFIDSCRPTTYTICYNGTFNVGDVIITCAVEMIV